MDTAAQIFHIESSIIRILCEIGSIKQRIENLEKPPSSLPIAEVVHENDNETIINIEPDERQSLYQKWLFGE